MHTHKTKCERCGRGFFTAHTRWGRPPKWCDTCRPVVAREQAAERQRRFRRYAKWRNANETQREVIRQITKHEK